HREFGAPVVGQVQRQAARGGKLLVIHIGGLVGNRRLVAGAVFAVAIGVQDIQERLEVFSDALPPEQRQAEVVFLGQQGADGGVRANAEIPVGSKQHVAMVVLAGDGY